MEGVKEEFVERGELERLEESLKQDLTSKSFGVMREHRCLIFAMNYVDLSKHSPCQR